MEEVEDEEKEEGEDERRKRRSRNMHITCTVCVYMYMWPPGVQLTATNSQLPMLHNTQRKAPVTKHE